MKNYNPKIAAARAVRENVSHGLSRHTSPELARTKVVSILTETAHVAALTGFARWLSLVSGRHLKNSTPEYATRYLNHIAQTKKQASVSIARQAINLHLLPKNQVPYVNSEIATSLENRAYTDAEIELLRHEAQPALSLSIGISASAGLRGMELITIAPLSALNPSPRIWHCGLFSGREDQVRYAVRGKGGLNREIRVTPKIAEQLDSTARPHPITVSHRGAHLHSHFDVIGGHAFSIQFGRLSKRILGFSLGAHGLRHSFCQQRRNELLSLGFSMDHAIKILSQELGHFCSKNTFAYLRDQSFQEPGASSDGKESRTYFAYR